ncbi:uncharacterized protein LOC131146924 [Malania oleifera]|uniref:uncharacterized protein LOC131146924 n=1 Tax=Malania oleifera TaxID=397392 RepID=UPI0025ADB043|nr:uncharacterized protein LOC131146924 [Malania oleifera]
MACWSAENATQAYLRTLKMGKMAKEPDSAEFISALAAGNNAQLMVVACASFSSSTTLLALVAAAHQTGGRVVCILRGREELLPSREALGPDATHVKFVIGETRTLLLHHFSEADFVLMDCNLDNHEAILKAMQANGKRNGAVVLGYNAFCKGDWQWSGSKTHLLPIGEGLLVTRIAAATSENVRPDGVKNGGFGRKKSHWIVKVDKWTGEEHVFRVRSPERREIEA